MKLNDLYINSLETIVNNCEIITLKPISNKEGEIEKIIIEYVPTKGNVFDNK